MTKPPVTNRILDRCQSCNRLVHRDDLVYVLCEFGEPIGSNYFLYHRYNANFWTCDTATDAGEISLGSRCDSARIKLNSDNTKTALKGSQTWTGTGVLRSITGVDASSWTRMCFACEVGPYHRPTASAALTVTSGFCLSDGTGKVQMYSGTTSNGLRIWWTTTVAALDVSLTSSSLYFYVAVTPASGESWWVDDLRLEKNKSRPETLLETAGSAKDITAEAVRRAMIAACERCRRPLLNRWDKEPPPVEPPVIVPHSREIF